MSAPHSGASRVPPGVPTGGQFAASTRAEATVHLTTAGPGATDYPTPTTAAETFLSSDQRLEFAEATLVRSGQALRSEARDDSSVGYHEGRALADAQAFWLLQRPHVPPPHEVAWSADQFIEETLHSVSGTHHTRPAQNEFISNLGPYEPLGAEHAAAIHDHFLVTALAAAHTVNVEGDRSISGANTRALGALNGACTNAIRFRTGETDPRPDEVTALEEAMRQRAAQRRDLPRAGAPTVEEARAVERDVYADAYAVFQDL